MMKIKIAYLYYDLMNLNGEHANIKALIRHFENAGASVNTDYLTIGDNYDLNKYDIVYMGQCSLESGSIALNDMLKHKDNISSAIENGVYFFLTGTSLELFGKSITNLKGEKSNCLGLFPYYVKHIDIEDYAEECKYRVDEDVEAASDFIDQKIIGFQNRAGLIYNADNPIFKMIKGTGNNLETKDEGFNYKNVYATYIIGPIFIRNPYLTDYFVKKIILEKDKTFDIKIVKNTAEYKAYKKHFEN